jgi:hypothetical protein
MSSEIPIDFNAKSLSCQLGGLTLNGNVANGTAANYTILTVNDPAVIQTTSRTQVPNKFLKVMVGQETYYLPVYQ